MGYFFLMLLFVLVFLFGFVLSAIDDDIEEKRRKEYKNQMKAGEHYAKQENRH